MGAVPGSTSHIIERAERRMLARECGGGRAASLRNECREIAACDMEAAAQQVAAGGGQGAAADVHDMFKIAEMLRRRNRLEAM